MKIFTMILVSLLLFSCGAEDPNSDVGVTTQTFNSATRSLPALDQPATLDEPVVLGTVTNVENSTNYVLTTYKMATGYDQQMALDPTSDVIYPGSILFADSILAGTYVPFLGKRAPMNLSISLEGIAGKKSQTVQEPRLSSVRDAIGDILAQEIVGATPARVSFTIESVVDTKQIGIALGAKASASTIATLGGSFNWSDTDKKSRIIVKFMQTYYSIDIDTPYSPSDFFAEDANWEDLYSKINTATAAPVYVASIYYGRTVLCCIESTVDGPTLTAAANASFTAKTNTGSFNASAEYTDILENSTIKLVVLGGNGATAVSAISGLAGVNSHIANGGNYGPDSPGAPLSYKLRYLSDNSIASIVYADEYTVRTLVE